MRIVLIGTDLAPVRTGAGALESLLAGWAAGLAIDDEVTVLSVAGSDEPGGTLARRSSGPHTHHRPEPDATVPAAHPHHGPEPDATIPAAHPHHGPEGRRTTGGQLPDRFRAARPEGTTPSAYRTILFERPEDLRPLVEDLRPDAVVLNNRPGWQRWVPAPTVHLFHNWPDAWALPPGVDPATLVGQATAAAVSGALAATVAATLGRPRAEIGLVTPFVDAELLAVDARPEPGLVVSPNRLMVKKGVRELAALAGHPAMRGRRVLITDYLSPWTAPTAEHAQLRATVGASAAELVPPPRDRTAMAALYARAEVVVCPSIRPEGLGLTAIEAQAVGVPVVSSGLGGLAEATLLPDLIADPADQAAFTGAVAAAARLDGTVRRWLREEIRRRHGEATSVASLLAAARRARPAGHPPDGPGGRATSER